AWTRTTPRSCSPLRTSERWIDGAGPIADIGSGPRPFPSYPGRRRRRSARPRRAPHRSAVRSRSGAVARRGACDDLRPHERYAVTTLPPTLTDAAELLDRGETTSRRLTEACLARIEARDHALRAFITVETEAALHAADEADARRHAGTTRGALDGLPLGVKDNLDVAGRATTMGSALFRDHVPEENAGVVDRRAGHEAVRLGATTLHEFALGVTTENPHFGICRNPWDPGRTPGGSSGGSAVAVASGMALGAIGSDTSGSIRIPAAACGIVGLKPTYGRVSSYGCYPAAWSLDHVGVLTRAAADAAVLLDALSGHDPRVGSSLQLPPTTTAQDLSDDRPLRIGIEEQFFFDRVDPAVEDVVRSALEDLARTGTELVPIALPALAD